MKRHSQKQSNMEGVRKMKRSKLMLSAALLAGSLVATQATDAKADLIGIDFDGAGFVYSDLWTNMTDSGLALGFVPGGSAPYTTSFLYQARIGTTEAFGTPTTPSGLNSSFELTLTMEMVETVVAQGYYFDFNGNLHEAASFTSGPSYASTFTLYLDDFSAGVQADPNNVSGYGDGVAIMSGHLLNMTSSFDATLTGANAGTGTGSFQTLFWIDSVDESYVDLYYLDSPIIGVRSSGDTKIPPYFTPSVMWDGTSTASGILMKVDASEAFLAPEPSTMILVGTGLGLIGLAARRNRKKKNA